MDVEAIRDLNADALRERLVHLLAERVNAPSSSTGLSRKLSALLASWSDSDAASVVDAVASVGTERRVHNANPILRQTARAWCRIVLAGSSLDGAHYLAEATAAGPTVVVCNHQSYIDSNAIDFILFSSGFEELANRFVSAAGPKVYEGLFRRIASASINTLPVPQSASLGHTARLPKRELARHALQSVAQAHTAMQEGRVLLIYPEGARTRTRSMQRFLPAIYRYFKLPDARVVPAALTGTADVMGVGERDARPEPCALRLGPPIVVQKVGGPRNALSKAETAVNDLLPSELRLKDSDPTDIFRNDASSAESLDF